MSFNYDETLSDAVSQVRFAIGDVDADSAMVPDEAIQQAIDSGASVLQAAAEMADSIGARFARRANVSIDGASFNYGQLAENFAMLAQRLRARAATEDGGLGRPVVTGINIGEMQAVDNDKSRVPSQFKIGQFDNTPREGGGDIGTGGVSVTDRSENF